MWPTTTTYAFLLLGAAALVFVAYRCYVLGLAGFVELPSVSIICTWFGFHLSPLLYLLHDERSSFLLVEEYIDVALAYTTCAMWCFVGGYFWRAKKRPVKPLESNMTGPGGVSIPIRVILSSPSSISAWYS